MQAYSPEWVDAQYEKEKEKISQQVDQMFEGRGADFGAKRAILARELSKVRQNLETTAAERTAALDETKRQESVGLAERQRQEAVARQNSQEYWQNYQNFLDRNRPRGFGQPGANPATPKQTDPNAIDTSYDVDPNDPRVLYDKKTRKRFLRTEDGQIVEDKFGIGMDEPNAMLAQLTNGQNPINPMNPYAQNNNPWDMADGTWNGPEGSGHEWWNQQPAGLPDQQARSWGIMSKAQKIAAHDYQSGRTGNGGTGGVPDPNNENNPNNGSNNPTNPGGDANNKPGDGKSNLPPPDSANSKGQTDQPPTSAVAAPSLNGGGYQIPYTGIQNVLTSRLGDVTHASSMTNWLDSGKPSKTPTQPNSIYMGNTAQPDDSENINAPNDASMGGQTFNPFGPAQTMGPRGMTRGFKPYEERPVYA